MKYVVYTEIIEEDIERWYYGTYETVDRANEVALELGHYDNVYHCVCSLDKALEWGEIQNMPK